MVEWYLARFWGWWSVHKRKTATGSVTLKGRRLYVKS